MSEEHEGQEQATHKVANEYPMKAAPRVEPMVIPNSFKILSKSGEGLLILELKHDIQQACSRGGSHL